MFYNYLLSQLLGGLFHGRWLTCHILFEALVSHPPANRLRVGCQTGPLLAPSPVVHQVDWNFIQNLELQLYF